MMDGHHIARLAAEKELAKKICICRMKLAYSMTAYMLLKIVFVKSMQYETVGWSSISSLHSLCLEVPHKLYVYVKSNPSDASLCPPRSWRSTMSNTNQ